MVIGRRMPFSPGADPVWLGGDLAISMSEPLGTLAQSVRVAPDGVRWIGVLADEEFPKVPGYL